jgi:excisionase family DNA binding protein
MPLVDAMLTMEVYVSFRSHGLPDYVAAQLTTAHAMFIRTPPKLGKSLTVKQAAEYLGVKTGTIYDMLTVGKLPSHRIGGGRGTIRDKPADVDALQDGICPSRAANSRR